MLLPAKIEYAYKAMIELSLKYNADKPLQIGAISRVQRIPQKFLVQLLLRLKNAGLVNSSRGISGGYYLTRPPSEISLADVFRAIDDNIAGIPRTRKNKGLDADRLLWRIWDDVGKGISQRLEEMTFEKLISQLKGEQLIYQI